MKESNNEFKLKRLASFEDWKGNQIINRYHISKFIPAKCFRFMSQMNDFRKWLVSRKAQSKDLL